MIRVPRGIRYSVKGDVTPLAIHSSLAARCILPVSQKTNIPGHYGLRHRAAIGVTEVKDCIALVVSEETGNISMVTSGEIQTIKPSELKELIEKELNV